MTILLKDIYGNDLVKIPQEHYKETMVVGSINTILLFLGLVMETLVIVSILRIRQKTVDTLFILSLCCADLCFNLYMFPSFIIILSKGGWSTGVLGCKLTNSTIIAAHAISILSVTFITLNRYMLIIWKKAITRYQALAMIAIAWISLPCVISIYGTNKERSDISVGIEPSFLYCFMDFTSTNPVVIVALLIIITFMSAPFAFMSLAYTQIILFYRKMNRSREYVTSQVYQSERKLLVKAIAITSAFLASYSFELIIRLYQFSTKSQVNTIFDLVGTFGICSNTLWNSILLLNFDGFVQSSALELLGIDQWWREKINKSKEKALNRENKKLGIELLKVEIKKSKKTEEQTTIARGGGASPFSLATQKMNNDNE